jgi:hypothetical protein
MHVILSFDKIAKLTFSYAGALLKSPALFPISSAEKAILGQLTEDAEHFEQEFAAGFVPSSMATFSAVRDGPALPKIYVACLPWLRSLTFAARKLVPAHPLL